jgi:transcriptional regulator with XRE-family HTH domain
VAHKHYNYLRASRKKLGLSQRELAYLLGAETSTHISRYERRKRLPSIETALACQAILGVPVSEIFGGTYESIANEVKKRAREMAAALEASQAGRKEAIGRKLQYLAERSR